MLWQLRVNILFHILWIFFFRSKLSYSHYINYTIIHSNASPTERKVIQEKHKASQFDVVVFLIQTRIIDDTDSWYQMLIISLKGIFCFVLLTNIFTVHVSAPLNLNMCSWRGFPIQIHINMCKPGFLTYTTSCTGTRPAMRKLNFPHRIRFYNAYAFLRGP